MGQINQLQDGLMPGPEPYDFQRPTTLARDHSRTLDVAFDTFSRQLGSMLSNRLRTKTTVNPASAKLGTYSDYIEQLPSHTVMMLLRVDDVEARGVFQLPLAAAVDWVSRMLGSNGETVTGERKLTPTEVAVLRGVVAGAMEDLAYSFTNVLDAPPTPEPVVHYNPGFAQAATPTDLMVGTTLVINTGSGEDVPVTLYLPSAAVMPKLGSSNPVDTDQDAARLAMEQLGQTPVEVLLETKKVRIDSLDVLRLKAGDVLDLGHSTALPFHLTVDGHRLATAIDVIHGSRKFMQINETEFTNEH
ncbi:flagellar motor switch protein FliM (plasmid) [Citricoccus nitrophenolicus]